VAAASLGGTVPTLDGELYDRFLAIRAALFAPAADAEPPAQVAVLAVDARTLDAPDLRRLPRTFFGPVWAQALDLVIGTAGARVVGFDFLFDYNPADLLTDLFADRPGTDAAEAVRRFDRPMLTALSRYRDRVVLGRSASTLPIQGYQAALRYDRGSFGALEYQADRDGVFRRVEAVVAGDEEKLDTLAAAVLRRAGFQMPPDVLLAPRRKLESLPTYSLRDVLECGRSPDGAGRDALRAAFAGRVVLIGSTQPDEDRKLAPDRYMAAAAPRGDQATPCALPHRGASLAVSASVPGVYLHAAAVDAVLGGAVPRVAPLPAVAAASGLAGAGGALAGMTLAPWAAAVAIAVGGAGLAALAIALLGGGIYLPVGSGLLAAVGGLLVAYAVRYLVEERRRRRVQHAFSHYLSPSIVNRLADEASALRLGGERRDVTVMFADLSGFTALSERVSPETLVSETNRYLRLIVEAVEATGGYIDKFIGDAVMAIWGAPVDDPDHARHAVLAAVDAAARVAAAAAEARAAGGPAFAVKIGLNSGPAIVGNVGTERRFNYTAVGETVNIASRLEGVVGLYKSGILIGEDTQRRLGTGEDGGMPPLCELDRIVVKGKTTPLAVFAPLLSAPEAAPAAAAADRDAYAAALQLYRQRRFGEAAALWREKADRFAPAAVMADRAALLESSPPPADWNGAWVLTSK
jgi:class 3 adenylate cyclase/CHASE2 domain-containing sensor protein